MRKYAVSIVGKDVTEKIYSMDSDGRRLALVAIETAMIRGESVCVDVVEYSDDIPGYIKDYVSI